MALQILAPPPDLLASYRSALEDYFGTHAPENLLFYLPVGTLRLEELAKGATLHDTRPAGSRFFAAWPDGNVTSCEMTRPQEGGTGEFRNIVQGNPVHVAFSRILQSRGLDAIDAVDYELRFLSIPGIQFEGIHLVHKRASGDLVLPVFVWDLDIQTDAVLKANAFLKAARPVAAARIAVTSTDPLSC
jgi:hypothetical protein